jgi:hypothetical protein
MAATMLRAEMSEISCSADLPPKRMATRSLFFIQFLAKIVEDRSWKIEDRREAVDRLFLMLLKSSRSPFDRAQGERGGD